ncbi:16S rRNA (adenine(1518)-N(6)/adenine(1519)-N(6))-dimethyltransferase RsmA [Crateriforma conspicua]|uniref:Ribosomal RNA small subunit methyltransferase A n=1 Tax=Crateriforma conspicua TaxID=2527996 RepID=A0A5C6FX86_9PLAN|nr:16S rRNA (adenine(1518)-N(6)/adenine(1519)-N(6))-dimethyltransferase RsmA [Crateriforma conspicua]TWU67617.1 Ribosomal RNA adenine dimethylase [Crateriforma conspicua]
MSEPSRQTATYLSRRLTAAGLKPLSRFGQNFLIDLNLVDLIANSAELTKDDVALEIGTGVGSLTQRLADRAGAVLSVEIDNHLFELAGEELADRPNVKLIHGDALKNKNTLRDEIMLNVRQAMSQLGENARFMLVANLPYNVATPIISNLMLETPPPDRIVVTIQKELADRIMAVPSTKDYGALSVWLQAISDPTLVRVLSPKVFWPRPKVHSAILRLDLDRDRYESFEDPRYFHDTTRALFFHRRKFLRSVVVSAMKGRLEKADVDQVLADLGHDETARAEAMTVPEIVRLVEAIRVAEDAKSENV